MQRHAYLGDSHAKTHGVKIAMRRHAWPQYSHAKTCMEWRYPCEDMHRHA